MWGQDVTVGLRLDNGIVLGGTKHIVRPNPHGHDRNISDDRKWRMEVGFNPTPRLLIQYILPLKTNNGLPRDSYHAPISKMSLQLGRLFDATDGLEDRV